MDWKYGINRDDYDYDRARRKLIKELRLFIENKGVSVKDLSKDIGIKYATIQSYFYGRCLPKGRNEDRIREFLKGQYGFEIWNKQR